MIRYGDELAMGDDLTLPERNAARTPMQWSTEPNAGFSKKPKTFLPVIAKGPFGFEKVNAADQRRDPGSFLNWTERMIRMRKECPEFGWGDFTILDTGTDAVLAMRYDWRNNAVLAVHNFDKKPRSITLALGDASGRRLTNLLTEDHSQADGRGQHHIELEPFGYRWFRVGGLDYIMERSSY